MVGYKDFPTPAQDFLKHYTALWATMAQVGVKCRIKYVPKFEREGTYSKALYGNYRITNQQERKEVISNGYKKETSCEKETSA